MLNNFVYENFISATNKIRNTPDDPVDVGFMIAFFEETVEHI